MEINTHTYIAALGGYKNVADLIGKSPQTVNTHMQDGVLPSAWYDALCGLAKRLGIAEPPRELFSFLKLPELAPA